jgi:hypothetical protein
MRKRAKTSRAKLTERLDKLCRDIIRIRDEKCQRCGSTKMLECSHVKSKGHYPHLRWDLLNMKLLCHACHFFWWHKDPLEASDWFRKQWPHRMDYLESKGHEKITLADMEELETELTKKLKELQDEDL